ncbi:MAG: hypothetical protein KJO90_04615 [Eudoraea sp.]|nr:hypothetical protein [Eudoraea sp.]MCE2612170.1 hypothetical protein [Flavobacteriaceae bacterium D16]
MDLLKRAEQFESRKWSNMTTSDRVEASREAKDLILSINELYKETKDPELMDLMKRLTVLKQKVEKRLKGRPLV